MLLNALFAFATLVGCTWEQSTVGNTFADSEDEGLRLVTERTSGRFRSNSPTFDDADLRCLFVGNSHTQGHDLAGLVADLIQFRRPNTKTATESIMVGFLDQAESTPAIKNRLIAVKWDMVVLQAQQISASGRTEYSTSEGIAFARRSSKLGAKAYFFAEWGLKGDAKNAAHTDSVYSKMATEAEASLIPVTRVWTRALAERPDLALYSEDGNHQSRLGASLTALTIAVFLLDESPDVFNDFPDPMATRAQWRTFVKSVAAEWEFQRSTVANATK